MNNALGMSDVQGVGHLNPNVEKLVQRQRLAIDLLLEALTLQQLHGDEVLAVALLDGVYRADIGMVQCGRGPRFPLEALQRIGILFEFTRKELQGNVTAQARVFRLIHHTHSASA